MEQDLYEAAYEAGKKAGIREVIEWGNKGCNGHGIYQYGIYI